MRQLMARALMVFVIGVVVSGCAVTFDPGAPYRPYGRHQRTEVIMVPAPAPLQGCHFEYGPGGYVVSDWRGNPISFCPRPAHHHK